ERDADHVAIGTVHRDLGRPERRAPHLDGDEAHAAALDAALALDDAALGVDRERGLLRPAVVPEELGEDAQPVTRLLRLAAVRVEDTQAEIGARARHQEQDAIRADAPVPVADPADRLGRKRAWKIALVHDDVVVAEPVSLHERNHDRLTPSLCRASHAPAPAGCARRTEGSGDTSEKTAPSLCCGGRGP